MYQETTTIPINSEVSGSGEEKTGKEAAPSYKELEERLKVTQEQLDNILSDCFCPITYELMRDPVFIIETGHTFERRAIKAHFNSGKNTDPVTNEILKNTELQKNWKVLGIISNFLPKEKEKEEEFYKKANSPEAIKDRKKKADEAFVRRKKEELCSLLYPNKMEKFRFLLPGIVEGTQDFKRLECVLSSLDNFELIIKEMASTAYPISSLDLYNQPLSQLEEIFLQPKDLINLLKIGIPLTDIITFPFLPELLFAAETLVRLINKTGGRVTWEKIKNSQSKEALLILLRNCAHLEDLFFYEDKTDCFSTKVGWETISTNDSQEILEEIEKNNNSREINFAPFISVSELLALTDLKWSTLIELSRPDELKKIRNLIIEEAAEIVDFSKNKKLKLTKEELEEIGYEALEWICQKTGEDYNSIKILDLSNYFNFSLKDFNQTNGELKEEKNFIIDHCDELCELSKGRSLAEALNSVKKELMAQEISKNIITIASDTEKLEEQSTIASNRRPYIPIREKVKNEDTPIDQIQNGENEKKLLFFKKIYTSLREGQSSFFKTKNFLLGLEKPDKEGNSLSVEEQLKLIEEHRDKKPNSRTAKAWGLTQASLLSKKPLKENMSLFCEIYHYSFEHSRWGSRSQLLKDKTERTLTIFRNTTLENELARFKTPASPTQQEFFTSDLERYVKGRESEARTDASKGNTRTMKIIKSLS